MAFEVKVGYVSEGGSGNFEQDPAGGTGSMTRKRGKTKSGYLTFNPGGMSIISWRTT